VGLRVALPAANPVKPRYTVARVIEFDRCLCLSGNITNVAGNRVMRKVEIRKYVVRLSAEERQTLEAIVHKGTHPASQILKAQILLRADISEAGEGWRDERIVAAFDTSLTTVHRTRQRLVEEGFDAALQRKQRARPSVPRIFDGEKEARLITLACSKPPTGHAKWSLRLLEEKVVELGIVERASDNTIGRTLKKTFSNRT
jgi:Homeodomain-like domain